jgi:hypothetical protein
MLYFPQLATGALAQFPVVRRHVRRTVVNRMPGGDLVKLDDPGAAGMTWVLRYRGLTEAERSALETLFVEAEGQLRTFTFLDPCGNLLRWSEDLSKPVWQVDGGVQVGTNTEDPNNSRRVLRITNTAQAAQGLEQKADVPGWFEYCFSFEARAAVRTRVILMISNSAGTITTEQSVDQGWTVCSCSGRIDSTVEDITCRVALEAGTSLEAAGFQLQAQPSPGTYRRTAGQSGVYGASRFLDDELQFVANGIDDHATEMRVFSRTQEQL